MTALPLELEQPEEERRLRWSSVRSCPRKAVYEATGAPRRDRTRQEEGWLWRGKQLGRDFAIILAAEEKRKGNRYRIYVGSGVKTEWPNRWRAYHREQAAFVVEEPVPWEFGVMHPDIHVLETDAVIEVLSSAHASEAMVGSKMLQLVGQIAHLDAAGGAVVVVDPSNPLDYELFPIARTSKTYADLETEMRARIEALLLWREQGVLPSRVCSKPSDARSHFCLNAGHCFQGWEPPDPDATLATDEAAEIAAELYRAKQVERGRKQEYDVAVSERKEREQRLEQLLDGTVDDDAKTVRIGAVEVNRIRVADREQIALKKARTAGAWTELHDELFAPFMSIGGGHVRYQVDRVGDQPLENYGDEAPWTAADLDAA